MKTFLMIYDNKIKVIGEGSICGVDTNLFRQVDNEKKIKIKIWFDEIQKLFFS